MENLINKWVECGIKNSIITEDNKELIIYGIYQLFSYASFVVLQIIIFCIFNCLLNGIVFLTAFIFLRKFIGGYHADTRIRCFVISNSLSLVYCVANEINIAELYVIAALIAAVCILGVLAPVENDNKRLSEREYVKYKYKTLAVLFTEILIGVVFKFLKFANIERAVFYAIIIGAGFVLGGYIKLKFKNVK